MDFYGQVLSIVFGVKQGEGGTIQFKIISSTHLTHSQIEIFVRIITSKL